MADQGIWWKLWASALDDPDLDNLDVADFGRYCKLGAMTKRHGVAGTLAIPPPARALCAAFQVADYRALECAIKRLPHVTCAAVTGETSLTVTFCNWAKYQGDNSTWRVRKHREVKRYRREEKRRETEEKRIPSVSPHRGDANRLLDFLNEKAGKHFRRSPPNIDPIIARLKSGISFEDLRSVVAKKSRDWGPDAKMAPYLRPATLFNATKCEQYLGELHGS